MVVTDSAFITSRSVIVFIYSFLNFVAFLLVIFQGV